MGCFHPNVMDYHVSEFGEPFYRFKGSAYFEKGEDLYYDVSDSGNILVPCGKCIGCRIDRSRVWADRMVLELRDNDYKALFVTLTYDNLHLPWTFHNVSPTLSVRDCQLWLKRLRKKFAPRRIRYFLAGEYGPKNGRPHYHAIIFGLTLADFPDAIVHKFNDLGQPIYQSDSFASIWSKGFCSIAPCSYSTCAYTARYTMKKCYKGDPDDGLDYEQQPEFSVSSRCPGIGLLHARELLEKGDRVSVPDSEGVHDVYLGRAFFRSAENSIRKEDFSQEALDSLANRRYNRRVSSIERTKSNLLYAGKNVHDFYKTKEDYFISRIKLLPERM